MEFPAGKITIFKKLSAEKLPNLDNNGLNVYKWNVFADKNHFFLILSAKSQLPDTKPYNGAELQINLINN